MEFKSQTSSFIFKGILLALSITWTQGVCRDEVFSDELPCVLPAKDEKKSILESNDDSDKISGGTEVERDSAPWVVGIFDMTYSSPKYFCAGAIVSHGWVLTSAQCIQAYNGIDIMVSAGDHTIGRDDGTEQNVRVTKIEIHPSYDPFSYKNDIALLKIFPHICFNKHVNKVRLDKYHDSFVGDACKVYGWGEYESGGAMSSVLLESSETILPNKICKNIYGSYLSDTMICASNEDNPQTGPCQGDWGGPLVCSHEQLAGVASWSSGCGDSVYPAVYTSVPNYYYWITNHIHSQSNPFYCSDNYSSEYKIIFNE